MVALSAKRLVCAAMVVISLTTSPMRPAARDRSLMRPSVFSACFTASPAIVVDDLHLPADLVDRGAHLAGRRGDRLHVGGSLFGGGGNHGGELLGRLGVLGQGGGRRFQVGRGRRHRPDDIADRALELVGELAHHVLALGHGACGRLFLLGLERLQPHKIVAEGARRARGIADFVAAAGIGDVDVALPAGQLQQHAGDGVDRPADRHHAEGRAANQQDDDKEAEAEVDAARLVRILGCFRHALHRLAACGRGRLVDQRIDLGTGLARLRQRLGDFGIGFFRRRHFFRRGVVVLGQGEDLFQPRAVFFVDAVLVGRLQIADGLVFVLAKSGERLVGFALGDRQADFARADLHALQGDTGMQEFGGHRLVAAPALGLPCDRGVAELLVEDHGDDQHGAGADGDRQFGADAQCRERAELDHVASFAAKARARPNP